MAFGKMGARGGFGSLGVLGKAGVSGPVFDVDSLFSDISSSASYFIQPDHLYIASINTTMWFEQTYLRTSTDTSDGLRAIWARSYNHTTKAMGGPYVVGLTGIANDAHGVPIPAYDQNTGYIYCDYGSHGTPLQQSVSTNPNDPTAWTPLTAVAGQHTYPKHVIPTAGANAGVHYLFTRNVTGTDYQLQLTKSTAVVAGVPTWGTTNVCVDLGANSRCDAGPFLLAADGMSIHGVFTRPDNVDSTRKDVFYGVFNTNDDKWYSYNLSFSMVIPMDLTSAQTNFRVVDQTTPALEGNVPAFNFDLAGNSQLVYMEGGSGGPYSLMHRKIVTGVSGSIGSPTTVGAFPTLPTSPTHRFDGMGVIALPDGSCDLYWVTQSSTSFARGGDISKVNRTSGGAFGAQTLVRAATASYALDGPSPALNAQSQSATSGVNSAARVHLGETNGVEATESGNIKAYAYGDGNVPLKYNYSSLSRTLFSTLQPLTSQKQVIDDFINALDALGIWSAKMEAFYLALNDFTSGSVNWASPGNNTLTQVSTPTFTALTSFKGNGTSTKFNANFNPTGAPKSSLNSAALGVWIRGTDTNNDAYFDIGAAGGGVSQLNSHYTSSANYRGTITSGTNANFGSSPTAPGFHILSRTASNLMTYYKNGVSVGTAATASTALPNASLHLCGTTTAFSAREVVFGFHAAGLTTADALNLFNYGQKLRNGLLMV